MKWKKISTIPKTGEEVLVCNTKQGSILTLIKWDTIHKRWLSKGKLITSLQDDYWTRINKPKKDGE